MAAGILASAFLVFGSSLLVGHAFARLAGARRRLWTEPTIGFSVLVVLASALHLLSGSAAVSAILTGLLVAGCGLWLLYARIGTRDGVTSHTSAMLWLPAVAVALVLAWLPFAASGHIGPLGSGINHDLAAHLNWTAWLAERSGPEPWGIEIGYPLGTHALAAVLMTGLGVDPLAALLGVLISLPMLGAVLAMSVVRDARPGLRALGGSLIALPYLFAGSFVIGSFKEIEMGLLLLALAVTLEGFERSQERRLSSAALVAIVAGMLATYSYAALAWAGATVAVWAALGIWRIRRTGGLAAVRESAVRQLPLAVGVVAATVVVAALELVRSWDLLTASEVSISSAARLSSGIPVLEVFGSWPTADFLGGLDSPVAVLVFGGLGLVVVAMGTMSAWRDGRTGLVAALAASVAIALGAEALGSFYTQAKALTVPAAVVMALALFGFVGERASRLSRRALAAVFVAVSLYSSFLVLRQANVAPPDRRAELEDLRARIAGDGVLAITSDRFAAYSLRGGPVLSPAFYSETVIRSRPGKTGEYPVDFDSARFGVSDAWKYLLTTGGTYQSAPSRDYRLVERTPSFSLWKRRSQSPPSERITLAEGIEMGAFLDCSVPGTRRVLRSLDRRGDLRAHTVSPPVLADRKAWTPRANPGPGESTSVSLDLPEGVWDLSMQYFSPTLGLRVETPESDLMLPPDAFGRLRASGQLSGFESPYWPAGKVVSDGGELRITVSVEPLNWFQRLIGLERRAEIGTLAALRPATEEVIPAVEACGRYVDYLSFGSQKGMNLADPALQVPSAVERSRLGERAFEVSGGAG